MPTIALVDDDRNILTSVSLSMEAEGFRVQTYTDGASALTGQWPTRRTSPSSTSRCRAWTALASAPPAPEVGTAVIFLTSKDEEIDELFGLKMGRDDFIRNPFRSAAGRARQGDPAPRHPRTPPRRRRPGGQIWSGVA